MIQITLPQEFTDATLPILYPDELIGGSNGGVLFLFDLSNTYCWPGGDPNNNDVVRSITGANDGSVAEGTGGITFAVGGGFDYSSVTSRDNAVKAPVAVAAAIKDGTEDSLACCYIKLPTSGDWVSSGSPMSYFGTASTSYISNPEWLMMGPNSSGQSLSVRRQSAAANADQVSLTPNAAHFGAIVQIAGWRKTGTLYGRIKSTAATVGPTSASAVAINTQDFSTTIPRFGIVGNNWPATPGTARKVTIYRGWIENLATSGRTPVTVLDQDWARFATAHGL